GLVCPFPAAPETNKSNAALLARQEARLRQQFRQAADNAVGTDWGVGRQADAGTVVPDRADAKAPWGDGFPFEGVADHPRPARADYTPLHRILVGAPLRLAA